MIIYALVDYDNVKTQRRETSLYDVQSNLLSIVNVVITACTSRSPDGGEVRIRFYGGWINERGYYSQLGELLLASLRSIRGIHGKWRVIPDLAVALAILPETPLQGTLRTLQPRIKQKMVDTMIAVDTIFFANQPDGHLLIASDDDDMVPATLAARKMSQNIIIAIRKRRNGQAINDHICNRHGIFYIEPLEGI